MIKIFQERRFFFTQQKTKVKIKTKTSKLIFFCYHCIHKYLFLILYLNRYLSVRLNSIFIEILITL